MKNLVSIIVIILMILVCPCKSVAQDIPIIVPKQKLDSLQQLIKNHPEDNEQKVLWLNEYTEGCFYNYDLIEGFNTALKARELSKAIDFKGGIILYHLNIAKFLRGNPRRNYHIEEAERLSRQKGQSKYYSEIIIPDSFRGYVPVKKERYKEALKYYTANKNRVIQSEIVVMLSAVEYFGEQNYVKSYEYAKEAANLFESFQQDYWALLYRTFALNSQTRLENNEEDIERTINDIIKGIRNVKDLNHRARIYGQLGSYFHYQGNQPAMAVEYHLQSASIREKLKDSLRLANNYESLSLIYGDLKMHEKAYEMGLKNIALRKALKDSASLVMGYRRAFTSAMILGNHEQAEAYLSLLKQDTTLFSEANWNSYKYNFEVTKLIKQNKLKEAIPLIKLAHKNAVKGNNPWQIPQASLKLANVYHQIGDYPEALKYALRARDENEVFDERKDFVLRLHKKLSEIYAALGQNDKAYEHLKSYQKLFDEVKITEESSNAIRVEMRSALRKSSEKINQLDKERAEQEQANKMQRLWIFSITGGLVSTILILLILYRNNKSKQKANALLRKQKDEIQKTLDKLKATQDQLIQSEKMASLGELTAGIAHEIQNPLNFVNNFSEVSNELIEEMTEEIDKKDYEEAKAIAQDLKGNLEKINHHGIRAADIVKGMLMHSRGNSGEKEPTDINTLADEYLRLSYHGYKAKDKSFNAQFNLHADESLPKVNVIPQDIGRVLLNLINNAFYVVNEKAKSETSNYKPLVEISTKNLGDGVEIRVKDNGNGIPEGVKDKIFQPFFTTKPTGKGTGLGLSLSYDIIKAHSGELKVESVNGEGTQFIILLKADNLV
ncbi:ATP-binding protein [Seonamhaeicola maritimus]|uniref:ATP-binding protein n=1 Tax=Seonamhaeicola maritimus TaxID=2591822 RepID=UPI0024947ED7|nr:ATP-binding protein [Seonamhaeicola maritimus]